MTITHTAIIPTLDTAHLVLRPWSMEDADSWFNILQEEGILRYFPNPTPPSQDKAEQYINHHRSHWRMRGYGHWAVIDKQNDLVVGWCGLEYLAELNETELAYLLSTRVWGRGYATEAARASVQFGFELIKLEKIIGLVHPENLSSVRVLEKCGMKFTDRITLWGMEMFRYQINKPTNESKRISKT